MAGTRDGPAGDKAKKPRQPQIADDDHHAEQQPQRFEIDDARDVVQADGADCEHQTGADKGRAGAVEPETGQAADRDDEVSDCEYFENRGAGRFSRGRLVPGERRRAGERRHCDDAADLAAPARAARSVK